MPSMKKNLLQAEKRTKSGVRCLVYSLLVLASFWILCGFIHFSKITKITDTSNVENLPQSTVPVSTTENGYISHAKLVKSQSSSKSSKDDGHVNLADGIHIVFSTDCSKFQDWQTLLLFHSAAVVRQPGTITRVASGCNNEKRKELVKLYSILHPTYNVHFTPDFKTDAKTNKKYDFYNKPYGILHWLENSIPSLPARTVVALIDPDFIFLRPLSPRMKNQVNTLVSDGVEMSQVFERAGPDHPVAQFYGLGAPWARKRNKLLNRTRICGLESPCLQVPSERNGSLYYSVGAPYILDKDDMLRLAKSWVEFVPRVYEGYPDLLAEMFAYSMAAAHEKLPHLRVNHLMVSNIDMDEEGWPWIDALGDDVGTSPAANGIFFPDKPLPNFVHYCQFYRAAKIGFQKRRVFGDIFSCERGLFVDLPADLALVNHKEREGGEIVPQTRTQVKRSTFMLSAIHASFNSALVDYKNRICKNVLNSSNINFEKVINLANIRY